MQCTLESRGAAAAPRPALRKAGAQFLRYVVVGGLAFVVDAGLLFVLASFAGVHYLASAAVSFMAGLVTNYALSRSWVFDRRSISNTAVEFTVFALIGIVGLGLNQLLMWTLTERLGFYFMLSKCGAAAFVLAWSFAARKLILFSR